MVNNKIFALIFRGAALVFSTIGVLLTIGVFGGRPLSAGSLFYYTTQSNLLAIVMFGMLTFRTAAGIRKKDPHVGYFPRFSMICAIDILLTFLVYWILLVPTYEGVSLWTLQNLAVHAITPLLCLADYVLFTKSRHLKYRDVYLVTVYPLLYVVFATVVGFAGINTYGEDINGVFRFPYFFFDYDRIGVLSFAYIGGLLVFFILVGHGFYFADRKIRRNGK